MKNRFASQPDGLTDNWLFWMKCSFCRSKYFKGIRTHDSAAERHEGRRRSLLADDVAVEKTLGAFFSLDRDVEHAVERDEQEPLLRRQALGSNPGPGSTFGKVFGSSPV